MRGYHQRLKVAIGAGGQLEQKATSLGATYGYEMAGRNERNQVNHYARVDDFTFAVAINGSVSNVPGSGLASLKLEDSRVQSKDRELQGKGSGKAEADRPLVARGSDIPG
jgi:hypothetical protein